MADTPALEAGACNGHGGSTPSRGTNLLLKGNHMFSGGELYRYFFRYYLVRAIFIVVFSLAAGFFFGVWVSGCATTLPDNNNDWAKYCLSMPDSQFANCIKQWEDWDKGRVE